MSSSISILHLSDIHFRKKEKAGEKYFQMDVEEKLLSKIGSHVKEHSQPDIVAITGDIAFDGKDYKKAEKFFLKLRELLPDSTFLPVPGNHDVDRGQIFEDFSLHNIIVGDKVDKFLEKKNNIKTFILPKFRKFKAFATKISPGLYDAVEKPGDAKSKKKKNDYFWVKEIEGKGIAFLGLNSAWACEGDDDQMKIALGYPQVKEALSQAGRMDDKILLMHHPPVNWLKDFDDKAGKEVLKNCRLVLCGHTHSDRAFIQAEPGQSCIFLSANASYTTGEKGFIGFQFLEVEFKKSGSTVNAWPYIYDDINLLEFKPHYRRYPNQGDKPYFELSSVVQKKQAIVPEPLDLKIPGDYKDWIKRFHSTLSIEHLSKKGEAVRISLPKLYIHIETANPFYKPDLDDKKKSKRSEDSEPKEPESIDIETLLGRQKCILLKGAAGMGKTTLVKHLAYSLTQAGKETILDGVLPVLVFFKDLWPVYEELLKQKEKNITFESLLEAYLTDRQCPLRMDVVKAYLESDRALFLLDGLDEVPVHLRGPLVELIATFQFSNKKNCFLLTGRPHGIDSKVNENFGQYLREINALDQEKINQFITTWFLCVSDEATGLAEETSRAMISDISHNEYISVFTENPLLLTAVCVLYQDGKRLPEQRADLYERVVANLVYKRFHDPLKPEMVGMVEAYLMLLAYTMQKVNARKLDVLDAIELIKEVFGNDNDGGVNGKSILECRFNEIEPHCGLLNRLDTGEVEFSHLTFQEFLTARYMIDKDMSYKDVLCDEWWKEVILLYIGKISLDSKTRCNAYVAEILAKSNPGNDKGRKLGLLGSRALTDIQSYRREPVVVQQARDNLLEIIESQGTVKERFEAGEILGVLGDPRIDEDNMVLIPAGKFSRGSKSGEDNEKPVREIYLDAFKISKYPVTNQEYRRFLEAGGYDAKEYWTKEGWEWKEEEKITEPELWHNRKWNGANFPVVGVSWYEVSAYANWLSITTGNKYRLPTEAEWEKAARGQAGREYPWGDGFDKEKCNFWESGLGRTSPVGIFKSGQSPYQLFDMAGNVWEWCSDWYGGDYYKKSPGKNPKGPDGGSDRVLRGGGWDYVSRFVRCAYRDFFDPAYGGSFIGARLSQDL